MVQARLLFFKDINTRPIEIFCLEPITMDIQQAMASKGQIDYLCLVGRAKKWKDGSLKIWLGKHSLVAEKIEINQNGYIIRFSWDDQITFAEILEIAGKTPLPPYLNRSSEPDDKMRYQTVYAEQSGSVAAPTAGLHFTPQILSELQARGNQLLYTTLHVGAGTFKPVSSDTIKDHNMHFEEIHITPQFVDELLNHNGPRVSIGTTSVRTLESIYWLGVKLFSDFTNGSLDLKQWEAYELPQNITITDALIALKEFMGGKPLKSKTQLMIIPGYKFRMINSLITNFHQPKSTLLLLVSAICKENWKTVYNHALKNNYRFLSYGDSSIFHI